MNNMYKPNLVLLLLMAVITALAVGCEQNTHGYRDRDNYESNTLEPSDETGAPVTPDHTDTSTSSGNNTGGSMDSAGGMQ